jgi:ADP-glucose pyrophosphorylase
MLAKKRKIYVYNFVDRYGQPQYWRDIGTRDAYYQSHMDLLGRDPAFNLYDRYWPVRTYHEQYPPIKTVTTANSKSRLANSIVSAGCWVEGGLVTNSVLSPNVTLLERAQVSDSILMEGVVVGEGSKIRNAIIDKQVVVPPNTKIGYHAAEDRKHFVLTSSGIVIVPKRTAVGKVIERKKEL